MNAAHQGWQACLVTLLLAAAGSSAVAQNTNSLAATNAPAPVETARAVSTQAPPAQAAPAPKWAESTSSRLDDSAFRIISERNIFNANRIGQVRLSTRRPARVEGFTLVGTLAYEKGAFAFFEGTSSEFTKVLKTDGVIAGHKLVDILADAVKLEADGKILELPIGSAMRREDEGAWHPGEGLASSSGASSSRAGDYSSRSRRGEDRGNGADSPGRATAASSTSSADQSEVLKRLMESREKELK